MTAGLQNMLQTTQGLTPGGLHPRQVLYPQTEGTFHLANRATDQEVSERRYGHADVGHVGGG